MNRVSRVGVKKGAKQYASRWGYVSKADAGFIIFRFGRAFYCLCIIERAAQRPAAEAWITPRVTPAPSPAA